MKPSLPGLCLLLFVGLISPFPPLQSQSAAVVTRSSVPFSYDSSQEVTVDGTVLSVIAKPSKGMVNGSHILLTTPSGAVDVSLGTFALQGKGALAVTNGQSIQVTGIRTALKGQPVFFARSLKVAERSYVIRNEHGIPVSPQARERASKKTAQNGDTL